MVELVEQQEHETTATMTEVDDTPTTIDEVVAAAKEESFSNDNKKRPLEDDDEPKKDEGEGSDDEGAKDEDKKHKAEEPTDNKEADDDGDARPASSSSNNQVNHEQLSCNALVIFGLPPTIKQDEMKTKMEVYGKVTRLEIRRAFASVYCFCDYETGKEAQAAIEELNGSKFQERYTLIVKLANDKNDRSKPHTNESISSKSESKKQKISED